MSSHAKITQLPPVAADGAPVICGACHGPARHVQIPSSTLHNLKGGYKPAAILTNGQRVEGAFGGEYRKRRFRHDG